VHLHRNGKQPLTLGLKSYNISQPASLYQPQAGALTGAKLRRGCHKVRAQSTSRASRLPIEKPAVA
jgi:hypothetical protein